MTWAGKAFFRDVSEGLIEVGEIFEEVSPGLLLVRFDRKNIRTDKRFTPAQMVLIRVDDLIARKCKDGTYDEEWEIFESRKALDDYLAILDADDGDEDEKPTAKQVN